MNHEYLHITPKHTKLPPNEAEQFVKELGIAMALAKHSLPKGKKLELRFSGLLVLNHTMRPSGLFAIEVFDAKTRQARLILLHYLSVVFECAGADENQNNRPRPEIGFHTLFPPPVRSEGSPPKS